MTDLEAIFHVLSIEPGPQLTSHQGLVTRIDISRPAPGAVLIQVAQLGASVRLADLLPPVEAPRVYPPAQCPACPPGVLVAMDGWLAHIAEVHAAPAEVLPFTPEPKPAPAGELPCLVPGCPATFSDPRGRSGHVRQTHGWRKVDGEWQPPVDLPAPICPPFSPAPESKEATLPRATTKRNLSEDTLLAGLEIKPEVEARIEAIAARPHHTPTAAEVFHCDECGGRCQVPAHQTRRRAAAQAEERQAREAAQNERDLATYGVIRPGRAA